MLKSKVKGTSTFPIPLSTFCKILKAGKTRVRKKQIHHLAIIFRNNYYLIMTEAPKGAQVCANENSIFRTKDRYHN